MSTMSAMSQAIYRSLLNVMFLVSPERIHHWVFGLIRGTTAVPPVRAGIRRGLAYRDPILEQTVFGVRFPAPVGLAAGYFAGGLQRRQGALGLGRARCARGPPCLVVVQLETAGGDGLAGGLEVEGAHGLNGTRTRSRNALSRQSSGPANPASPRNDVSRAGSP